LRRGRTCCSTPSSHSIDAETSASRRTRRTDDFSLNDLDFSLQRKLDVNFFDVNFFELNFFDFDFDFKYRMAANTALEPAIRSFEVEVEVGALPKFESFQFDVGVSCEFESLQFAFSVSSATFKRSRVHMSGSCQIST
jgi:hypothetical protein